MKYKGENISQISIVNKTLQFYLLFDTVYNSI